MAVIGKKKHQLENWVKAQGKLRMKSNLSQP